MAAPISHGSREASAFLRGPVGVNTFALGTVEALRGGVQHRGLLISFPEPTDNPPNDFGIQQSGGFTVEIADEGEEDWWLMQEDGSRFVLEDDSGVLIMEY